MQHLHADPILRPWRWLLRRWRLVLFFVTILVAFLIIRRQDQQIEDGKRRQDRIEEVAQQVATNLVEAKVDNCLAKVDDRRTVGRLLDSIITTVGVRPAAQASIRASIAAELMPVPDDCVAILAGR